MDFNLTPEQEKVRAMVRDFADRELVPAAPAIDSKGKVPKEILDKIANLGLMGVTVPKKYGGAGLDTVSYVIAIEEIARACASTAIIVSVNNSLVCYAIENFGNEAQKNRFLVPLASGKKLGAYALTEANAGSDAAALETTAQLKNEEYILNGTKLFVTNGESADTVLVFATLDRSKGPKGICAFILEKGMKGFEVATTEEKLGILGTDTAELAFEDCTVPKEHLLGKEGEGFKIALATLDCGRVGVAAQAVGIAQAALELSLKYAKKRVQFGKPISKFQAIRFALADLAMEIDAARMLVYKAAYVKDQGRNYTKEAAMAKLYASEVAMQATRQAIQLHGCYGYTKESAPERLFRDAKITELYEGTSEIQRLVIARSLLD